MDSETTSSHGLFCCISLCHWGRLPYGTRPK